MPTSLVFVTGGTTDGMASSAWLARLLQIPTQSWQAGSHCWHEAP
jgi:hypothetical protein